MFTNKHQSKWRFNMNNLSIEDLVAYTTFTHSKNFSKLLKIAIDKYCTDIDKTIELQKFLMEKPEELINEYEKDTTNATMALELGAADFVKIHKKYNSINKLQFIQLLHMCRFLLPKGFENIQRASNTEKELIHLLIHCLIHKHHFDYENPHDVIWAISNETWDYIRDLLESQNVKL